MNPEGSLHQKYGQEKVRRAYKHTDGKLDKDAPASGSDAWESDNFTNQLVMLVSFNKIIGDQILKMNITILLKNDDL